MLIKNLTLPRLCLCLIRWAIKRLVALLRQAVQATISRGPRERFWLFDHSKSPPHYEILNANHQEAERTQHIDMYI